ncbi:Repeat-companion domain protein OS=Isosphaera pallida (strain ATCC 43644 / DSM 9630 / IS1B) GN=Isop_0391 PE=4 SV=1 [Gemmata massiliana]|uniref:Repeat-companion domain protein n=1 Tax=Gemmata massiliana TaxID=1210884 RepID=A0A6P2D728_9BACT|nr:TIGR02996 domain-containing protein [Gemmata massiliana]VTR96727.1 Repeat-companion domain protein OS=Isosphaera pallida (strain ATCC 43644 / DSM 9630 / IS1B) GN=Isop_0391 PE=4 SV=1 [Gemmata massiliana]
MSDETALLAAIYANPDEDTPRLVYADWLDEHGDPARAEFIRVQIELASRDDYSTEEYARLNARGHQLQGAHAARWLRHLSQFDEAMQDQRVVVEFTRGFPDTLSLSGAEAADFAILRYFPELRHLEVMHSPLTPGVLRDIACLPELDSFTTESTGFDTAWLAHLDPLPCWTHVRILEDLDAGAWNAFQERRISKVTLLEPDQQRAAAIRYLRATRLNDSVRPNKPVKIVRLVQESTTDAELRLLSYLPELEEIEIAYGRETSAGLRHLSKLPNVKTIHLGRANAESLVPLMSCKTLETLEYLGDGYSPFGDESVTGLEELSALKHLTLCPGGTGPGLHDATLHRIGALRELRTLDIRIKLRELEDQGSLASLRNLGSLESLTLNGRTYTGAELQQFLADLRRQ